jgi:hypothetical protein
MDLEGGEVKREVIGVGRSGLQDSKLAEELISVHEREEVGSSLLQIGDVDPLVERLPLAPADASLKGEGLQVV